MVQVMDPVSAMEFRLTLRYLRTETSGPLFEAVRARQTPLKTASSEDRLL